MALKDNLSGKWVGQTPDELDFIAATLVNIYGNSVIDPNAIRTSIVGTNIDAFGRLRTSSPHTLFDSKQIFDNKPLHWDDQEVSGSGTSSIHSAAKANTAISVGNVAGKRVRQTFRRFNYQPGKSFLLLFTANMESAPGNDINAGMGLFDDENGAFACIINGSLAFNIRSSASGSAVDNTIFQGSWNGDNLDGSGESGIALNPTNVQIFWMDLEWLGVGSVRFGFIIDGVYIVCHTFHHANLINSVYMSTPNLPVRFEIENGGAGAATTMNQICVTVIIEGGQQAVGQKHYKSTEGTALSTSTKGLLYAVIGTRLNASYIGQTIDFKKMSMFSVGSDNYEWVLMWNPVVAGDFVYADHVGSSVQHALGASSNVITGGHEMAGGMIKAGNTTGSTGEDLDTSLKLGSAIDGTRDTVVLCVRPLSTNASFHGSISWQEIA